MKVDLTPLKNAINNGEFDNKDAWSGEEDAYIMGYVRAIRDTKLTAYFARPISNYDTLQDKRDIETINALGFKLINPNKEEIQEQYAAEGMQAYIKLVDKSDLVIFRSFVDGKISAGVYKEIIATGKPVLELPTITSKRVLSVEDTREYLKLLGKR